jgi:CarboxypepD_reg-like domain
MELENFKHNLSRLQKCDQYWDDMPPIIGGRHCGKCDKKIVDFSQMTFTDIAFYMSESIEPICGFYIPEQVKEIEKSKNKFPIAIGLTALLATSEISNTEFINNKTEQNDIKDKYIKDTVNESLQIDQNKNIYTVFISGNIQFFDSSKKMSFPISYATVIIKGTRIGTLSKGNGEFKIRHYPKEGSKKVYLIISSLGFASQEVEVIFNEQTNINLGTISVDKYKGELNEFRVTMKKRSKFSKFWRKLTKPFRKKN